MRAVVGKEPPWHTAGAPTSFNAHFFCVHAFRISSGSRREFHRAPHCAHRFPAPEQTNTNRLEYSNNCIATYLSPAPTTTRERDHYPGDQMSKLEVEKAVGGDSGTHPSMSLMQPLQESNRYFFSTLMAILL